MDQQQDIAILLFSRSAKIESYAKQWTQDPKVNFRIAHQLLKHTNEQLVKAPFPVYHVDETIQSGNFFGERLTHAFKYVFNKGFNHVIAVGNDCTNLHLDWLLIGEQIRLNKTILGPDQRGGVYLIGISKHIDYSSAFAGISWKSKLVFEQLKLQFDNHFVLDTRQDINTLYDVICNKDLFELIKALLLKGNEFPYIIPHIPKLQIPLQQLRAPPTQAIYH